jgi:hypothetical protein
MGKMKITRGGFIYLDGCTMILKEALIVLIIFIALIEISKSFECEISRPRRTQASRCGNTFAFASGTFFIY